MTATEAQRETKTLIGLHASYPDRSYDVAMVGQYLQAVDDAWRACIALTLYRFIGNAESGRIGPTGSVDRRRVIKTALEITRLRIGSPMELAVAAGGGGITAIIIYSVHLLAQALRNPEAIGAWLPRLVAAWHLAQGEASRAKRLRYSAEVEEAVAKRVEEAAALIKLGHQLTATGIKPEAVTVVGAGEPPEEIVEAARERR
jgi:hypothetical protein